VTSNRIRDVGRGLKRIFSDMSDKIALSTMEGVVLGVFDQFTLEDVYSAICDDKDLWACDWGEYEKHRSEICYLLKDPRYTQYRGYLTVENVLEWLRHPDGKPEFASIIVNTPGGAAWLEKQITSLLRAADEPIAEKQEAPIEVKPE
jgi:hypothetical protein